MSASAPITVQCAHCKTKNRVQPGKPGAMCGRCGESLEGGGGEVLVIDDRNFQSEVMGASLPVLLDCYADWCGPCHMIAPSIQAIARESAGRLKVGKLNTDAVPAVAQSLQVQSLPTLIAFKEGRELGRLMGARPAEQIVAWLKQVGAY